MYLLHTIEVIDVGADLIPTLLALSSVSVTSSVLSASFRQVETYYHKFRTRFSAVHGLQLRRLISYLDAMSKVAEDWRTRMEGQGCGGSEVMSIPNYVQRLGQKVDGINLLEIGAYLKKSKVLYFVSVPDRVPTAS